MTPLDVLALAGLGILAYGVLLALAALAALAWEAWCLFCRHMEAEARASEVAL